MPSSADDEDAQQQQQQQQQSGCKRPHASSELWEFESLIAAEPPKSKVVLGVDGGGTCTVCVCVASPVVARDGSLPLLSRCVTASSNHNSVGGKLFTHSLLCSFVPLLLLLLLFLLCCFGPPPPALLFFLPVLDSSYILELDFIPPKRRFFFPPPTHFQVLNFRLFIVSFGDMNVWNHVQTPNIPSANHFRCQLSCSNYSNICTLWSMLFFL